MLFRYIETKGDMPTKNLSKICGLDMPLHVHSGLLDHRADFTMHDFFKGQTLYSEGLSSFVATAWMVAT